MVVKVEPGTEGNRADALASSSATNSTAGPASALTLGSKDLKGNSSALHWLADLATQKAKDDSKGELLCDICILKSVEIFVKVCLFMGYFHAFLVQTDIFIISKRFKCYSIIITP